MGKISRAAKAIADRNRRARTLAAIVGLACVAITSPFDALPRAHAYPNADATEEEGVCEILENNGGDYRFAFSLAVVAVKGDTGMGDRDAIRFARKAIDDMCPVYNKYLN